MNNCQTCRMRTGCSLYAKHPEDAPYVCCFPFEYTQELSAHYKPVSKTKKPVIVFVASYNDIIELAFNPHTKDSEAAKARDALNRAQKKGGDINRFQFIIPFYPGNGKIKIALQ